jgi:hypothetical protein
VSIRRRGWLVVGLGAIILSGPPVDEVLARKPTTRILARVDGKKLRIGKRTIQGLYATTSFSVTEGAPAV